MTVLPWTPEDFQSYSTRLLAFVDILGWSNDVQDETQLADLVGAVFRIRGEQGLHDFFFRGLDQLPGEPEVQTTQFSDCFVISCDAASASGRVRLLDQLSNTYVSLLEAGRLCRGALVVGRAVHRDNIVIGPALVDAYLLESKHATFPRIVMRDPDIALLGWNRSGAEVPETMRMDDGVPFLNPLRDAWPDGPGPHVEDRRGRVRRLYRDWVTRRTQLAARKSNALDDVKKLAKQDWLLAYLRRVATDLDIPIDV
jgi:hypothetical protein